MSQIQERKMQRREYLKQKSAAYGKMGLAALMAVPFTLLTLMQIIIVVVMFPKLRIGSPIKLCAFVANTIGSGVIVWYCARTVYREREAISQLPYVPPVTAGTMPAEEVLLRGSDASPQEQRQVLLRGSSNAENADGQELLRGSRGSDSHDGQAEDEA